MAARSIFLRRGDDGAGKTLRVLIVPHAGAGGASTRGFMRVAPQEWFVAAARLPGRESRGREPVPGFAGQLEDLVSSIRSLPGDAPLLLVGSCSGAALALEAARELDGGPEAPVGLVVLSRRAPHLPGVDLRDASDDELLAIMDREGGLPPEVKANAELLDTLLPLLFSDTRALDCYTSGPDPQLACAILTLTGDQDEYCPPEAMRGWSDYSKRSRHLRLPAPHLMLTSSPATVVDAIVGNLDLFGLNPATSRRTS